MGYGNSGTGAVTAGYAGSPAAEPRQPVILEQMTILEKRTEELNQLVAELAARLEGVLQPEPPSADKAGVSPGHTPVPLGQSIGQMNDRLSMLAGRVRNIIDRIEL